MRKDQSRGGQDAATDCDDEGARCDGNRDLQLARTPALWDPMII